MKGAGYAGRLLCGAGIVTGEDARAAVNLGIDGILVASSVVRSKDWESKIRELAAALLLGLSQPQGGKAVNKFTERLRLIEQDRHEPVRERSRTAGHRRAV